MGSYSRGWSAVTGTFEHCEADPAPYGARDVAQSTWRDARPTPYTKVRCRQCLGERRFGTQMSPPSNGFMVEASAERPASWIKRRFYHPMVLGQLPSAQLSTCRPLIRAQKLRSILRRERLFAVSTRRSESPVTFTESDVAVGMSISRVTQHRVMPDSAGDGRELFRWPWNGRLSVISPLLSTLRGGQKVTETVTYIRYLASGTCLTLCTHRQYTCGGGGDRKPRTKSF